MLTSRGKIVVGKGPNFSRIADRKIQRPHLLMSASDCPSNSAYLEESIPCDHLRQGEGFTVSSSGLVLCLALSDDSPEWLAVGYAPTVGEQRLDDGKSGRGPELSRLERRHWNLSGVPEVIDRLWITRNLPWGSGCTHITIPDTVREICDECFSGCFSLHRVTFGSCSILERLGRKWVSETKVEEVMVPDTVREICDQCFWFGGSLHRVTFGSCSSFERLGIAAFSWSGVEQVTIPDKVREICDRCFSRCASLRRVTFGESSSLERLGCEAFWLTGLKEIMIPDKVREICERCFAECYLLHRVTFGESSCLERLECAAFEQTKVREIMIPDTVREICDRCYKGRSSIRRILPDCRGYGGVWQVCVRRATDDCYYYPQLSWDRLIREIKEAIRDLLGIPLEEQVLVCAGQELGDTDRLGLPARIYDYKVPIHATIRVFDRSSARRLEFRWINVRTAQWGTIRLRVESTDIIWDIKAQIWSKTGIPPDQQLLGLHCNGGIKELEDGKTLRDYSIPRQLFMSHLGQPDRCRTLRRLPLCFGWQRLP